MNNYEIEAHLPGGFGLEFYEGRVKVRAENDEEAIEEAKRRIRRAHGNRQIIIDAVVRRVS